MSTLQQFSPGIISIGDRVISSKITNTYYENTSIALLKTGNLISYSDNLAGIVEKYPRAGVIYCTSSTTNVGAGTKYLKGVYWVGGSTYVSAKTSTSSTTSSFASSASLTGGFTTVAKATITIGYDCCMHGNTLLVSGNSGMNYNTTGTAFSYVAFSAGNYTACASNGTLAVMCSTTQNSLGKIYTSTNGLAWTARTPTGGNTGALQVSIAHWSPIANKFIYIDSSNNFYTTSDGYTLTSITTPTNFSLNSTMVNNACGALAASSTSSTIICGGGSIYRTTDGITYSIISLPYTSTQMCIAYILNKYYIYNPYSSVVLVSNDDGLTFKLFHYIISSNYTTNNTWINGLSEVNGSVAYGAVHLGTADCRITPLSSITPNWIGHVTSITNTYTNYIRIR